MRKFKKIAFYAIFLSLKSNLANVDIQPNKHNTKSFTSVPQKLTEIFSFKRLVYLMIS